jgi:hypothetical protein
MQNFKSKGLKSGWAHVSYLLSSSIALFSRARMADVAVAMRRLLLWGRKREMREGSRIKFENILFIQFFARNIRDAKSFTKIYHRFRTTIARK